MQNAMLTLRGIQTAFTLRGEGRSANFSPMMKTIPSNSSFEDYLFDEDDFVIKERSNGEDKKQFQDFAKKYHYQVRNRSWTGNIKMNRNDYEDAGNIVPGYIDGKITEAVNDFVTFPDKLIHDMLVANGNTFDGTAIFANTHTINTNAAFDNLLGQTGTTEANIITDMALARAALTTVQWHDNNKLINPVGLGKWYVICPIQLYWVFLGITEKQQISTGVSNEWYKFFTPVLNSYQDTSTNGWFMVYYRPGREPFFLQNRKNVEWKMKDDIEDDDIKWIADARYVAAPAWFTSILSVGTIS
jgi:hypothetical protein